MSRSGALEASEMLEAALEQMDGILAGTRIDPHHHQTTSFNGYHISAYQNGYSTPKSIRRNVNNVTSTSKKMTSSEPSSPKLPILCDTRVQVGRITNMLDDVKVITDSLQDKREVLKYLPEDQIVFLRSLVRESGQTNGFSHENCCEATDGPHDTLLLRVSVLTEQVQSQNEKIKDLEVNLEDNQDKLTVTEEQLHKEVVVQTVLQTQKLDMMAEISDLNIKLATAETENKDYEEKFWLAQRQLDDLKARLRDKDRELTELKIRLLKSETFLSPSPSLSSNCSTETEVDRLKRTIETLVVANNDKDSKINDLHRTLRHYKDLETSKRDVISSFDDGDDDHSDVSSEHKINGGGGGGSVGGSVGGINGNRFEHLMSVPNATSTPDAHRYQGSSLPSPPSTIHSSPTPPKSPSAHLLAEEMMTSSKSTPIKPPRQTHNGDSNGQTEKAEEEAVINKLKDERAQQFKAIQIHEKKKKGIKKIFSKSGKYVLKRSNSQEDVHNDQEADDENRLGEFKRGGIRATAGGRLGWSKDIVNSSDLVVPFTRWDSERCALWLHELGLSMYVGECRRNIKNGDELLKASSRDLEQDLGIKSHLHKKKLFLALKTKAYEQTSRTDRMHKLDHTWVTKWLDDVGLPQYKDAFQDGRIDGRMLHFLTVEDLLHLKVSSTLHHYSIKRGIQILRLNSFNPDCLHRRPSDDQVELEDAVEEVQLWTNHRVMEWLRSIDLSEYAPNLRGSGVHGALMVLEPAFNSDLFAAILSISPNKTLLRRHLKMHFTSLVGPRVQQEKREYEVTSAAQPLTPNMKIKFRKHGLFKRSKSEAEFENYVCPMEVHDRNAWSKNGNTNKARDWEHGDIATKESSKPDPNINTEIRNMTHMFERERFLSDNTIPATDV